MTPESLSAVVARRVQDLVPYRPGKSSRTSQAGKLSANESPFGPSPQVREAFTRAAATLHRYETSEELREKLASSHDTTPDRVIVTSGSDELVSLLTTLLLDPQDTVVLGSPCYAIDETSTRISRGIPRFVELRDGAHDLEAMAAAAHDARLLWLPSPHNPTGVVAHRDEVVDFLDNVPETCMVVLDEAYVDFVDPALRTDSLELCKRHPNLFLQRTFSKSHGLAGIRVGYGIGAPDIVDGLWKLRLPFSVNSAALHAASVSLDDLAWRDMCVESVRSERQRLQGFLAGRGVEFFPSQANFVTAAFGSLREPVTQALAARAITVRAGADLGAPDWTRITIGEPWTMALVREAVSEAQDRSQPA